MSKALHNISHYLYWAFQCSLPFHSTGSWRLAPWEWTAPSWTGCRAGSSPIRPTSWSATLARPREAWCKGCRWSSCTRTASSLCHVEQGGHSLPGIMRGTPSATFWHLEIPSSPHNGLISSPLHSSAVQWGTPLNCHGPYTVGNVRLQRPQTNIK